jgi:palmitoyltransferase ZDHHC2/15/20
MIENFINWIMPFVLISYFILNYYAYVFEFCLNKLIKEETCFKLALFYLYFFNLIFIFLIWSLMYILIKDHPNVSNDYKILNNNDYEKKLLDLNVKTLGSMNKSIICQKCNIIRPDRCYHCKKCSKCILKRDHHCPWINNCIGYANQKCYILFLIYLVIFQVFILITLLYHFDFLKLINMFTTQYIIIIYFFINLIVLIFIFIFTLNTLYLASINSTYIECLYPPSLIKATKYVDKTNPFDLNSKIANLTQIFGNNLLTAFLPISTTPGNGHSFKVVKI